KRGLGEMRIGREEAVGRGVDIGEVAAAAAGDQDLLSRPLRMVDQQHPPSALPRDRRAHQPRPARAEHDRVEGPGLNARHALAHDSRRGACQSRDQLWKIPALPSTSPRAGPRLAPMRDFDEDFELESAPAAADRLTLDLDGWEGPLDLLLTLARTQRVDLAKISILSLVEQYLAFIADAKMLRLEIAADYLVMAAWLAYLKSCLL